MSHAHLAAARKAAITIAICVQRSGRGCAIAFTLLLSLAVVGIQSAHAQTYTILYNFTGGPDGGVPNGGLILDSAGNIYGTTADGGNKTCGNGEACGTVFKVSPSGTETVLYSFQSGTDGFGPTYGVVADPQGNLYGTTSYGGTGMFGTVFKLTAAGTETILHDFVKSDGALPYGITMDARGNLYGATQSGGRLN